MLFKSRILGLKDAEGKQKVNHVTVFERPGLREFLQQISKFANLVLFTAGLEGMIVYVASIPPSWSSLQVRKREKKTLF